MKTLNKIDKFDESALDALLAPVWLSKDIVNETGLVVGEIGKVQLLSTPIKGSVEVKNIFHDILYEEGVDYTIEGSCLKRIVGGNLPYFDVDSYFRKEPNAAIQLKADPEKIDFAFPEERYIYFSEGVEGFEHYITVSYKVDEALCDNLIVGDNRLQGFLNGLKTKKSAKILLYGDSITVGCNATGTKYGGNVSPYQPSWNVLMKLYLQKKYGAEIEVCNQAVGGWSSVDGIDNFEKKCSAELSTSNLFCIGFGANDLFTDLEKFKQNIIGMIDGYLQANPNGTILLYSCLLPNSEAKGWRTQHAAFEGVLEEIAKAYTQVGLARVSKAFLWLESQGKRTRDLLANSINHPNDFGVRVYAQVLLKTLLGEDFY